MSGPREAVEIERKYDVRTETTAPRFASFRVEEAGVEELRAVYFDSADGDLLRARITLRRREGGHDDGWHVKLPAAEGRTEVTAPLEDHLPSALADRLTGILHGRGVEPVARLDTTRTRRILSDQPGHAVAEFADDIVRAVDVRRNAARSWREWEVELLPGAAETPDARRRILDAIEAELLAAGAVPSASVSKLARALGVDPMAPRPTSGG